MIAAPVRPADNHNHKNTARQTDRQTDRQTGGESDAAARDERRENNWPLPRATCARDEFLSERPIGWRQTGRFAAQPVRARAAGSLETFCALLQPDRVARVARAWQRASLNFSFATTKKVRATPNSLEQRRAKRRLKPAIFGSLSAEPADARGPRKSASKPLRLGSVCALLTCVCV